MTEEARKPTHAVWLTGYVGTISFPFGTDSNSELLKPKITDTFYWMLLLCFFKIELLIYWEGRNTHRNWLYLSLQEVWKNGNGQG